MLNIKHIYQILFSVYILFTACSKGSSSQPKQPLPDPPTAFNLSKTTIDDIVATTTLYDVKVQPQIKFSFGKPIDKTSVSYSINLRSAAGALIAYNTSYENADSVVIITPSLPLDYVTKFSAVVSTTLKTTDGGKLKTGTTFSFIT